MTKNKQSKLAKVIIVLLNQVKCNNLALATKLLKSETK